MLNVPAFLFSHGALPLLTAGVLLIYLEFNRPGSILPGAVGLLFVLLAASFIARHQPAAPAIVLLLTSAVILGTGLRRTLPVAVPIAATLGLIAGFHTLFAPPVSPLTSILCGLLLGGTTAYLTRIAHHARRNKGLD